MLKVIYFYLIVGMLHALLVMSLTKSIIGEDKQLLDTYKPFSPIMVFAYIFFWPVLLKHPLKILKWMWEELRK